MLWIKASGARLADALARDAFVAVDLVAMRGALAAGAAAADRPAEFALGGGALRPSIETSLHAIFPKRVVLHAHCVNTIAFAIRKDARERLAERLDGFAFVFQPYVKPGARLADAVARSLRPGVDVVVLGNHGLVTAGETVEAAERLMLQVSRALREPAADFAAPDVDALSRIAGDGYEPLESAHPLHGVARSPRLLQVACGGSPLPRPHRLLRRRRDGARSRRDRGRRRRAANRGRPRAGGLPSRARQGSAHPPVRAPAPRRSRAVSATSFCDFQPARSRST